MRLEESMNLQPRLISQQTANLILGKPSTSVSFDRDALFGGTRQVQTTCDHGLRYVFRQFDVDRADESNFETE